MSRFPDLFIGQVFVPNEGMGAVLAGLQKAKLWANLEDGRNAAFRGGGPHGFLVEGKNLLVMGGERPAPQGQALQGQALGSYSSRSSFSVTYSDFSSRSKWSSSTND